MAPKILVVDDDPAINEMLTIVLEAEGFHTSSVTDGAEAVQAFRSFHPDLILLDLMLPGMNGIDICREIRKESAVPIVMLTAKTDTVDVVLGLESGADDYITKPFSVRELVARVGAVMRRPRTTVSAPEPERVCGDLVIDLAAHEARVSGQVVQLTRTEFDLLAALSGRPHQAFSRRQLIDIVWDPAWVGDERLVDVHIKNLRRKLDADPARYIDTVRGVGYRMAEQ